MPAPLMSIRHSTPAEWVAMPLPQEWVLEGKPAPYGYVALRSADEGMATGVWECGAGRFHYEFRHEETIRIEAGSVAITDAEGRKRILLPGDFAHFPAGARTNWQIDRHLRKTFFLRLTRPPQPDAER